MKSARFAEPSKQPYQRKRAWTSCPGHRASGSGAAKPVALWLLGLPEFESCELCLVGDAAIGRGDRRPNVDGVAQRPIKDDGRARRLKGRPVVRRVLRRHGAATASEPQG